jgi:hypothetical protein
MRRFFAILSVLSLLYTSIPQPALAADLFNPNIILADSDLLDTKLPADYAQNFLVNHHSGIASRTFTDMDGKAKTPGALIAYYGKVYGVSQKYLLALIQKEQSLVTDPNPSKCQLDWATGYGRPDGSGCDDPHWQAHRGFASQIMNAAEYVQYFYAKDQQGVRRTFGYQPGEVAIIDNRPVIPANVATAMLYTYTPHLHGNTLLANIWASWFQSQYPDGSFLQGPDGQAYLVQNGFKRPFASKSALYSRVDQSQVITVDDATLAQYPTGSSIKFADYSLVRTPKTGGIYLLSGNFKRPIVSMKVFRAIGFNPEEINNVSPADLADYADGTPITLKSAYPTGALLQDKKSGNVYYVESGKKYPILSAEIMKADYPGKTLSSVSTSFLDALPAGDPVKFKDGTLVTSPVANGTIYVISNGTRRPFASPDVLTHLGYSLDHVIVTSDQALEIHPLGPAVITAIPDAQLVASNN